MKTNSFEQYRMKYVMMSCDSHEYIDATIAHEVTSQHELNVMTAKLHSIFTSFNDGIRLNTLAPKHMKYINITK
jgi:hypothetical protein